jgi:hypothetical protein
MEDHMTLAHRDLQRSFFDVSFLAENLFDGTDLYSLFRQEILPALEARRAELCAMYCANNGRPPIEPVIGGNGVRGKRGHVLIIHYSHCRAKAGAVDCGLRR